MALITAAQAREQIPELTGVAMDTLLESLIDATGRIFARWCGYPAPSVGADPTMEPASYTRYYRGPGGRVLRLDVTPVNSITSIYDDPDGDWGADDLVASGDYSILDGTTGTVLLASTSTHGAWSGQSRDAIPAIKVTYSAGYVAVPDGLAHLAKLAVKAMWTARPTQRPEERGDGALEALIPAAVRQGLQLYRLPRAVVPS